MSILTDKDRQAILSGMTSAGIFVTCGKKTPNIMVAHFGTLGKLWGKEVFMLPVKSNKYSYQIITATESFALNVPTRDMRDEIARCDIISGYTHNKFEELGLHVKRAKHIEAYVLGVSSLIVECKVIAMIPPEGITPRIEGLFPTDRNHTLFVGEVVGSYKV